jgi:hypothetical protein
VDTALLPPGTPPGVTAADLIALVEKLRRIPDSSRQFRRPAEWAWRRLRIRPELLAYLTERGLPNLNPGAYEGPDYDQLDLVNCSLLLGQGTVARAVRRFWPIALGRAAEGTRARYEMQFQVRCPAPGHESPCHFEAALPDGERLARSVEPGAPPGLAVHLSPEIEWPELPPGMRTVTHAMQDLEFAVLHESIRWDLDFIRASSLADCAGGARFLAAEADRLGLPHRLSFGYIVAPPFAVEHYWTDLRVGDVWVPIDPVLIRNMVGWGVLDGGDWPLHRSIGPLVVRIAESYVPVVTHDGAPIPFTLPVRLLAANRSETP